MNKQLDELFLKLGREGKKICMGEYRLTKADAFDYTSKTTGKKETFAGVYHVVEIGDESLKIRDTTGAVKALGNDLHAYESPYQKGEFVVVELTFSGYVSGRGEMTSGVIHSVKATETKAKL